MTLGMVRNNKLPGIIMGSVLLLYNRVAIITCINKHKYICDSCIIKLIDHMEIGLKENKITESLYYASYISLLKLRAPGFISKYIFVSIISSVKVRLEKGISLSI